MRKVGGLHAGQVVARILFNATLTCWNSSLKQQTSHTNDDPIKTKYVLLTLPSVGITQSEGSYWARVFVTQVFGMIIGIHTFKYFDTNMCTLRKTKVQTTSLNT